jgi:hypothetical protein
VTQELPFPRSFRGPLPLLLRNLTSGFRGNFLTVHVVSEGTFNLKLDREKRLSLFLTGLPISAFPPSTTPNVHATKLQLVLSVALGQLHIYEPSSVHAVNPPSKLEIYRETPEFGAQGARLNTSRGPHRDGRAKQVGPQPQRSSDSSLE